MAEFWISGDGFVRLDWRTYRMCNGDDGPGPCDGGTGTETADPQNFFSRAIVDFRLHEVAGSVATGSVTKSNDPQLMVGSRLTLTLRDATHMFATTKVFASREFCSEDDPSPTPDCN